MPWALQAAWMSAKPIAASLTVPEQEDQWRGRPTMRVTRCERLLNIFRDFFGTFGAPVSTSLPFRSDFRT